MHLHARFCIAELSIVFSFSNFSCCVASELLHFLGVKVPAKAWLFFLLEFLKIHIKQWPIMSKGSSCLLHSVVWNLYWIWSHSMENTTRFLMLLKVFFENKFHRSSTAFSYERKVPCNACIPRAGQPLKSGGWPGPMCENWIFLLLSRAQFKSPNELQLVIISTGIVDGPENMILRLLEALDASKFHDSNLFKESRALLCL